MHVHHALLAGTHHIGRLVVLLLAWPRAALVLLAYWAAGMEQQLVDCCYCGEVGGVPAYNCFLPLLALPQRVRP